MDLPSNYEDPNKNSCKSLVLVYIYSQVTARKMHY